METDIFGQPFESKTELESELTRENRKLELRVAYLEQTIQSIATRVLFQKERLFPDEIAGMTIEEAIDAIFGEETDKAK